MNETTNLKLKKPAGNEYISVETINGNMDIIDTGMKEISDSVDAPEFDASGTVEGITDKAGLLASFVTRMPLVKFMRNVVAGFKLVLYAGQVVNNCVTDNASLPLSAAQGKVLMDLYTVLNTNKAPLNEFIWLRDAFNGRYNTAFISDANAATTSGFYRYYANSANTPWAGGGTLFTLAFDGGSGIVQITFFNGSPAAASLRARYNNTWTGWKAL